ncbi:ATP-binding protein [Novosphingobium sp. MD-1]|uniref:ATP-binding protein n=1 Tax=Novosphingobium sp. MD-1 TaxID=1630648 RepID=UPI00061C8A53|nr:ATP-binding protein [Novosphingobium sp. MD-1]GAO53972.1 signal transduction histidine kinase [Novosphingobium sp. MD-1]
MPGAHDRAGEAIIASTLFGKAMIRLRSHRLVGYAMVLLLGIAAVQAVASLAFYETIDRETIREDHARRVAELLVVSERLHAIDRDAPATIMSTSHLQAGVASSPAVRRQGEARAAVDIRRLVLAWEPALAGRTLLLDVVKGPRGQRDLVGSMRLGDGAWLNFRSPDVASGWAVALRATIMTLLATVLCVGAGLYALRALMRPLAQLARAADAMAHGQPAALRESGPAELRDLARSLNDMQARISGLETDQAKSFEAISHDLRTPLSRLKIASDFVDDSDISRIVSSSTEEMEAMLMSLQSFLRAQHMTADAAEVDLVAMVRDLLASLPGETHLEAPPVALARTYREPLLLALTPLVENALQYGERARVTISGQDSRWRIEIADGGPGIPEDCFDAVLDPFFRLDSSRARNTAGFGLGIPTAHRLLQRFGGRLSFRNGGPGLIACVDVPTA